MSDLTNSHALVIGIADYQHINKLPPTILNDAQAIYDVLIDPDYGGYPASNVQVLLNRAATREAFMASLSDLAARTNSDSTVFTYVSGHGGRIEAGPHQGEYVLLVDVRNDSDDALAQSAVSGTEITDALRAIPARRLVVIFDTCHAGGIGQFKSYMAPHFKAGLPDRFYETLSGGRGRVIIASSRDSELSWILDQDRNSLFTKHLLAGMRGGAPGPGSVIRIFDLFTYLQPLVTAEQPNQHPVLKAEVEENFPVVRYRGGKAVFPLPATSPDDHFKYDVFISYNHASDKTWVRKNLLPRLKAEGLRVCIDFECFDLGAYVITEMERAVQQSRYTLAIVSSGYLESGFTELEKVMAQHLGLETRQRRLMAILRDDCDPPLSLRVSLLLDLSDDGEFEVAIPRLVYQLRQPTT